MIAWLKEKYGVAPDGGRWFGQLKGCYAEAWRACVDGACVGVVGVFDRMETRKRGVLLTRRKATTAPYVPNPFWFPSFFDFVSFFLVFLLLVFASEVHRFHAYAPRKLSPLFLCGLTCLPLRFLETKSTSSPFAATLQLHPFLFSCMCCCHCLGLDTTRTHPDVLLSLLLVLFLCWIFSLLLACYRTPSSSSYFSFPFFFFSHLSARIHCSVSVVCVS